ncbi:hypothetical protein ACGFJT_33510 [Actinomadura geliboluensis]|uniref:hypothetical protein n=1 Tax=Actinomadura geliboluensis TaxID=882440 RepID=UPI00371288A0
MSTAQMVRRTGVLPLAAALLLVLAVAALRLVSLAAVVIAAAVDGVAELATDALASVAAASGPPARDWAHDRAQGGGRR